MIVGVPNVGKSTLINILTGRSIAKTGNEPAVTKGQQRIHLGDGVLLLDTPGMMVPKIENPNSGFRLAICSAIKDTALDYGEVGLFLLKFLVEHHLGILEDRYGIESGFGGDAYQMFELIGQKRGCLTKRSGVDYDRVGRVVLNDFRSGKLGTLTLESPEMIQMELEELKKNPPKKRLSGPPRSKPKDEEIEAVKKEGSSKKKRRNNCSTGGNCSPNNSGRPSKKGRQKRNR